MSFPKFFCMRISIHDIYLILIPQWHISFRKHCNDVFAFKIDSRLKAFARTPCGKSVWYNSHLSLQATFNYPLPWEYWTRLVIRARQHGLVIHPPVISSKWWTLTWMKLPLNLIDWPLNDCAFIIYRSLIFVFKVEYTHRIDVNVMCIEKNTRVIPHWTLVALLTCLPQLNWGKSQCIMVTNRSIVKYLTVCVGYINSLVFKFN